MKFKKVCCVLAISIFALTGCTDTSQIDIPKSTIVELGENVNINMDTLILYTVGEDEKPKPFKQINIDKKLELKEKVQIVCDYLSEYVLKDVKFEVNIDQENIAQLNVIKYGNSFQGSTGSMISYEIIKQTLLQDNKIEKWIDGFRLLDNNDPYGVMGHIELDGKPIMKK